MRDQELIQILSDHQPDVLGGWVCTCGHDYSDKLGIDYTNRVDPIAFIRNAKSELAKHQLQMLGLIESE